jgi:hypothetical protein
VSLLFRIFAAVLIVMVLLSLVKKLLGLAVVLFAVLVVVTLIFPEKKA